MSCTCLRIRGCQFSIVGFASLVLAFASGVLFERWTHAEDRDPRVAQLRRSIPLLANQVRTLEAEAGEFIDTETSSLVQLPSVRRRQRTKVRQKELSVLQHQAALDEQKRMLIWLETRAPGRATP